MCATSRLSHSIPWPPHSLFPSLPPSLSFPFSLPSLFPSLFPSLSLSHRCMIWCWRTNGSTLRLSSTLCTCACWPSWTCWRSRATGDQTTETQVRRTTRRRFTLHTPQASRTTLGSMLYFYFFYIHLSLSLFPQSLLMDLQPEALIWYFLHWRGFLTLPHVCLCFCVNCVSRVSFSLWMTSRTPPQTSRCSYMLLFLIRVRERHEYVRKLHRMKVSLNKHYFLK